MLREVVMSTKYRVQFHMRKQHPPTPYRDEVRRRAAAVEDGFLAFDDRWHGAPFSTAFGWPEKLLVARAIKRLFATESAVFIFEMVHKSNMLEGYPTHHRLVNN